jgi:hypothetical protein
MGGYAASHMNDVWKSSDGENWTEVTATAGWSARDGIKSVQYRGKMWVIGGNLGGSRYNDVWSSSDGEIWTEVTSSAAWSGRAYYSVVVYKDIMWVLGGHDGSGSPINDVWSSDVLFLWTPQYPLFGPYTSSSTRKSRNHWMSDSASVCEGIFVRHPSTLVMKAVMQSPSDTFMNIIVTLQHLEKNIVIVNPYPFLTITIRSSSGDVVFSRTQHLLKETAMLIHYSPMMVMDGSDASKDMKIGLQVDFARESIPLGLDYSVDVAVGVKRWPNTDHNRAYDCVTLPLIGAGNATTV